MSYEHERHVKFLHPASFQVLNADDTSFTYCDELVLYHMSLYLAIRGTRVVTSLARMASVSTDGSEAIRATARATGTI